MFDVSFVELMLIGVVALVVLGPEKLPTAARTAGRFIRRARSSWHGVRAEFEREFAADELKRSMREAAANVDVTADFRKAADDLRKEVEDPLLGHARPPVVDAAPTPTPDATIESPQADLPPGDSAHDADYKPHG